jgi:hypothetical protein
MIQIKCGKNGSFEMTDRRQSVSLLAGKVALGDQIFDEPGEYEVEGIEIVYGTQATLLAWEGLQITYVFNAEKPTSFEKSQFAPCNILLIDPAGELDKQKVNELLETYDPNIVVFGSEKSIAEIKGSLDIEVQDTLKTAESTLPTEGRELYLLSS